MVFWCGSVRLRPCAIPFVGHEELGRCHGADRWRSCGAGCGVLRLGEALRGGAGEDGADDWGGREFLRRRGRVDVVEVVIVAGEVGPGAVPLLGEDVLGVFLNV